ncbi:MAG: hypothetical protein QOG54_1234 [Actinomycetota bacterium]|jgi:hypothetical protein|nr:hypothetical protein [Actinomycetota bacterium]
MLVVGILLLGVGQAIWWKRFVDRSEYSTGDGSTTISPSPPAFDLSDVQHAFKSWHEARSPSFEGDQHFVYVVDIVSPVGDQSWTAAGYIVNPSGKRTPTVWTSATGRRWKRESLPVERRSPDARPTAVLVTDRSTTVFGFSTGAGSSALIWTSTKPGKWSLQRGPEKSAEVNDAVSTPAFDLAAGNVISRAGRFIPAIWRSSDGGAWQRVVGPAFGNSSLNAIDANGNQVVAGGYAFEPAPEIEAAILTSSDGGRSWMSLTPTQKVNLGMKGEGTQSVLDVIVQGQERIAVGTINGLGPKRPAVWRSVNGGPWTNQRISIPELDQQQDISFLQIERTGNRYLLSGLVGRNPATWISSDGVRWYSIPMPAGLEGAADAEDFEMSLAGGKPSLFGMRLTTTSYIWRLAGDVWRLVSNEQSAFPSGGQGFQITSIASDRDLIVAVGQAISDAPNSRSRGLAWRSSDGRRWTSVDVSTEATLVNSVITHDGGFLIGGAAFPNGSPEVSFWESSDGASWVKSESSPPGVLGAVKAMVETGGGVYALVQEIGSGAISVWKLAHPGLWARQETIPTAAVPVDICGDRDETSVIANGTSRDGIAQLEIWTRAGAEWKENALPGAVGNACGVGVGTAVVVGSTNGQPDAWHRDESGQWQEGGTLRSGVFGGRLPPGELSELLATPVGFFALGANSFAAQLDIGIWHSSDGEFWQWIPPGDLSHSPGFQRVTAAAFDGESIYLSGVEGSSNRVWSAKVRDDP